MGRAPCCDKANVKKGPWSPEEDSKLKDYIDKFGTGGNWITLPQKAGNSFNIRSSYTYLFFLLKQCSYMALDLDSDHCFLLIHRMEREEISVRVLVHLGSASNVDFAFCYLCSSCS